MYDMTAPTSSPINLLSKFNSQIAWNAAAMAAMNSASRDDKATHRWFSET